MKPLRLSAVSPMSPEGSDSNFCYLFSPLPAAAEKFWYVLGNITWQVQN